VCVCVCVCVIAVVNGRVMVQVALSRKTLYSVP